MILYTYMGRKRLYKTKEEKLKQERIYSKRWREKNSEKVLATSRANYWKMKIENPEKLKDIFRKQNAKQKLKPYFKEIQKIRMKTCRMAKRRKVYKPCEICNSYKTEIHHQDYSNPYDIIWLCHKHHIQLHKLLKNTDDDPMKLYEKRIKTI
jgi:hypothetical protein